MVHASRAKSNEIQAAGGLGTVAGASSLNGKLPIFIQSGNVNLETALAGGQGHYVCPCDLRVIGAQLTIAEACGTGAATIAAGIIPADGTGTADPDALVDDYSVATNVTAGTTVDLTALAAFTGAAQFGLVLSKGTIIYFSSDGGATTTGRGDIVLTAVPV